MINRDIVVKVENLTKSFKIPLEASSGIKQKLINILKGKKGYRQFTPLKDISFDIEEGDFFGIVGRNGSGKSTLLKNLAGIYTPDNGKVSVKGKLVPFIELGVGFNPELSGRENVFLNGALLGFSHKEMEGMYDDIVDFAELHDFMEERLKNYSSGMQVRLAFSIAIRADGDILLLDEVLAVGDESFQRKCFDYFEKLKKEKKTVILVTHDMSAVQRFCNKAMIIEMGRIKKIGSPVDIADVYHEDNINTVGSEKQPSTSSFNIELNKIDERYVSVSFKHKGSSDTYVGFTILKNGMNIAEINSRGLNAKNPEYRLDTEFLNPGIYEVSGAVFDRDSQSPIALVSERVQFTVNGYDDRRGAGMKLPDEWYDVEKTV